MDASRGNKVATRGSTAARRTAVVGKENICPQYFLREEAVSASRSPLPEGFLRAPLQDITHILSPVNAPRDDDDFVDIGLCKPLPKRPKLLEASNPKWSCESEPHPSSLTWMGLRKCESVQESVRVVDGEAESKHVEDNESRLVSETCSSEAIDDTSGEIVGFQLNSLVFAVNETESRVRESVPTVVECLTYDKKVEGEHNSKLQEPLSVAGFSKMVVPRMQNSSSASSTRPSLRSAHEKPKMSSLMKFR